MVFIIYMSSSVILSSVLCCELMNFIMLSDFLVGTLEYMLAISNDANFVFSFMGISLRSSIICTELLMMNACGSGTCSFTSLESGFASLFTGAFWKLMMGQIGRPVLCILGRPFILDADGLRFMYFHFFSL